MTSYKTKQKDEQGKSIYQDICFPVTKDFREKLNQELKDGLERAKEKSKVRIRILKGTYRIVNFLKK